MDNPPPPPTALVRQFSASSAAPPKKVPSLQHCFLSDGCFDVQKYLQRQVAARECSLWRVSTALNLIHGVGESLLVGKKARAVATGIKNPVAKMCLWPQRVCGFGIADHQTQRVPVVGYMYVNTYLMLGDSSMREKFRVRFRIPYFNYLDLLQWIGDDTHFACWCGVKSNNKMSSPIELFVLGSRNSCKLA